MRDDGFAPLSVPETLTCDVLISSPRVRLLGAVSCAPASFSSVYGFGEEEEEGALEKRGNC